MSSGAEGEDWEWVPEDPNCPECGGKGYNGTGMMVNILNDDAYAGQTDSTFANISCQITYEYDPLNVPEHAERDVPITHGYEPDDGEVTWTEYRNEMHKAHGRLYNAAANANNPKNVVYKLIYTADEVELMGNAKPDILTYAKEMRAKFICGELDVNDDAVWNNYVTTIHNLGWDNAIAAAQSAWDRMNGN